MNLPQVRVLYQRNFPRIEWEPLAEAVSYNVKRGPTKNFLTTLKEDLTELFFVDESSAADISKRSDKAVLYYDVEAILSDKSVYSYNLPAYFTPNLAYPLKGVLERVIQLNNKHVEFGSQICDIYLKKYMGEPCPMCWNKLRGDTTITSSQCPICYNTGFVGGYNKVEEHCIVRDSPEEFILAPYGTVKQSMGKQAVVADYPIIHSGDFVVESTGLRWGIDSVKVRAYQNVVTAQIAQVSFLPSNHPLYQINF